MPKALAHAGRVLVRNRNFIIKAMNLVAVAAVLIFYSGWATQVAAADAAAKREAQSVSRDSETRGPYTTDGTFTGSAQGYGGTVTSEVTIENGYIASAKGTAHDGETPAYFSQAERLYDDIVDAQTTDVDTVSGATFSSAGIINSVNEALAASGTDGAGAGE